VNEIERFDCGLREGFAPAGAFSLPIARHLDNGENDPGERRKSRFQERSVIASEYMQECVFANRQHQPFREAYAATPLSLTTGVCWMHCAPQ
jgi:hypothetical protein